MIKQIAGTNFIGKYRNLYRQKMARTYKGLTARSRVARTVPTVGIAPRPYGRYNVYTLQCIDDRTYEY